MVKINAKLIIIIHVPPENLTSVFRNPIMSHTVPVQHVFCKNLNCAVPENIQTYPKEFGFIN